MYKTYNKTYHGNDKIATTALITFLSKFETTPYLNSKHFPTSFTLLF